MQENDVIKLGRVKFRVKEIRDDENNKPNKKLTVSGFLKIQVVNNI